jgi:branched-chain amino acid transport system permease protein
MTGSDDPVKAENVGIDTTKYKVWGFMASSLVAGLAGGFYAHFVQVLTPGVFGCC